MSSPISIKLNSLFQDHQNTTKTFSDIEQSEIVTQPGLKYHLCRVVNTKVNMNAGCKRLTLEHCKNITIIAEKLPIMGVNLVRTDNTRMDIVGTPPKSGSGFVSLDHSILGELESEQDCMVEINECMGIMLNGTNISDKYHDSTWTLN